MTHQLADAVEGRMVPFSTVLRAAGGSRVVHRPLVRDWFWVEAHQLPLPQQKRYRNPEGEKLYTKLLAGKPARVAFEELERSSQGPKAVTGYKVVPL
jgi:hypothetical protein